MWYQMCEALKNVFFYRLELWFMIVIFTLAIAIFKSGLKHKFDQLKIKHFLGFIWTSFIAYVGCKPNSTTIDSRRSYKTTVFVSLLGGMIVWMDYKSSLKAQFAVTIKKYPFQDLQSLSQTNWR